MTDNNLLSKEISTRANKLLDIYYQVLSHDIDHHGYCTEFLGNAQGFEKTRLLCQTRCMYFLLEYASINKSSEASSQAITLYQLIKNKYQDERQHWLQYPHKEKLDNLYEYAFLIFSISKLHIQTPSSDYVNDLTALHEVIVNHYFFPESNFSNLKDNKGFVSQNALMHLFEAYLELYKAIPTEKYKNVLDILLQATKRMFYNPYPNLISEYSPYKEEKTAIYEPGHSFEWCCLLSEARQAGIDTSILPIEKKMAAAAEQNGVTSQGAVLQSISTLDDKNRFRIWPVLERLRYYAITRDYNKVSIIFPEFVNLFISKKTNLPIEFINVNLEPDFDGVKTTTSYHLINSLKNIT
jgi:mannose/cellobiose epimerase-like protein (N-acyl-D-glucosamine 2-epimerase family)